MLGVPFEITTVAWAQVLSQQTGGAGLIQVTFDLYELGQFSTKIYSPIFFATPTPEPGTLPLMLSALTALLGWARNRMRPN
jgi:hypothetical protein